MNSSQASCVNPPGRGVDRFPLPFLDVRPLASCSTDDREPKKKGERAGAFRDKPHAETARGDYHVRPDPANQAARQGYPHIVVRLPDAEPHIPLPRIPPKIPQII